MYNNEFRPMKRAHSPDFEGGGGYQQQQFRGYPGHPFHKRHRNDNYEQPLTLEDKIARLGETRSRNVVIGSIAKEIDAELSNKAVEEEKIANITAKICKCIVSFPTRVATYATLIGLISVKHYNVSCQIINTLHASYPVYLEAQKWQEALTIIHLLSSLVNCKVIRPSALLSQFELLLEITLEDNIPQARSDYYVYTVLSSLPFVAQELASQPEPQAFEQVLNTIETYLSKRSKEHLNVTRVWLSTDSTVQMDYLDSLWVQTKNFRANSWNEVFLHRPYNDKEYKDLMASSLIPQNSPTIQIPAHSSDYHYPNPRIVFRIFEDDVSEGQLSIPGTDKIERFCIENHIRNTIDEISNDPRDCARHLSNMNGSEQLPMKHILVEVILGELFALPNPKHPELLYHALLYNFAKIFGSSRNPDELKFNYDVILNEGVKVLYDNLDTMNVTCLNRFVQWFSFHLNNTEFLYPWQTWTEAILKEPTSPQAIFVREVLEHCIRFSFHKKISTLVSANLASLVPPEASINYKPIYADNPHSEELAATVKKLIVERADGKAISEALNVLIDGIELPEGFSLKEEKHSEKMLKIDIFTAVILSIASKSLTHLSSAIGKFRNVFKAMTRVDEGQIQLLNTMHSCMESHPQLQVILVDKLLKAELVEAKEVCRWLFSESMLPHHIKSYPWELLNIVLSRSLQVVNKLNKDKSEFIEDRTDETKDEDITVFDTKMEQAKNSYTELVAYVFDMFAKLLDNRMKSEDSDNWLKWVSGRVQQIYFQNYDSLKEHQDQIKAILKDSVQLD